MTGEPLYYNVCFHLGARLLNKPHVNIRMNFTNILWRISSRHCWAAARWALSSACAMQQYCGICSLMSADWPLLYNAWAGDVTQQCVGITWHIFLWFAVTSDNSSGHVTCFLLSTLAFPTRKLEILLYRIHMSFNSYGCTQKQVKSILLSRLLVNIDGVWIGESIYWIRTSGNRK
jgi:hypothetical protein